MGELRQTWRGLSRSPGFTLTAILILAVGIGANTAIFSLADAVILRPLPGISDPSSLVDLSGDSVSYPTFRTIRDEAAGTARMAAWSDRSMSLAHAGDARMVGGAVVSSNYFDVLGARPALGRFFQPSEDEGGEAVAVLAEGFWAGEFGADPAILGRTIRVNGIPLTIVGVAPKGFRGAAFAIFPDLWVPVGTWPRLATGPLANFDIHSRNWGWMSVFGRPEPGVPLEKARAALLTILRRDAAAHGEDFDAARWSVVPTTVAATGANEEFGPPRIFALLAGAVLTALLIACANLANLLLARGAARQKEIAVRQALGASRGRIARQVLSESLLLGLAGGAAGLVVASALLSLLVQVPLVQDLTLGLFRPELGSRAFLFAAILAGLVGVLFGLLPAWRASNAPAAPILAAGSSRIARGAGLNKALVSAQVALCLALLATSGLLGRSLVRALSIDLGLEPRGVTVAYVNTGLARYDAAPRPDLRGGAAAPARRGSVRACRHLDEQPPLSGSRDEESVEVEGYTPSRGERPVVDVAAVGPGYFRALGVPVLAGREFEAVDRMGAAGVAVVNRAMAERYWPATSPLGRRITVADKPWTVIGVVGNAKSASLTDTPVPQVWAPLLQFPPAALMRLTLVVKIGRRPRRRRGRDPPRGPQSRRRAARHADRTLLGRRRGAAASAAGRRDASRALRHPLARSRRGRHLRGRLVDDTPARGGIWNPSRAGRPRLRRAAPGPAVHGGVGGARRGVRSGAFGRRRARAPERALRPRARRSSGPRGRHASARGGGAPRGRPSRAPRRADRSFASPSTGVTVLQDFRYALRSLRKNPGFTAAAILTLALGIGANTAMFSLLDQVALRKLPVRNPDELVVLDGPGPYRGASHQNSSFSTPFSYPMYTDLRDQATTLSGMLARFPTAVTLGDGKTTRLTNAELVSGTTSTSSASNPAAGRLLHASDDAVKLQHPVAVLGWAAFQRDFGGNPSAVGQTLLVNAQPMTIVGVAPKSFRSVQVGFVPDVYVPMAMKPALTRAGMPWTTGARDGWTSWRV